MNKNLNKILILIRKINKMEQKKLLKEYLNILKNIKRIKKNRSDLLNKVHWEFENHNLDLFENRESKISKYLIKKREYTGSFLGSSLGFTKMNYESKHNTILSQFNLEKKPTVCSARNSLAYETLKRLIRILYEMIDKKN
ncbi:hypothetical protein A0H76_2634 [Hepatospora eriocheir]|uniref:Uncharacterized protein n=1 Tax=Hepatospora eriocheir TaxID=1081669 RepID=A0A1X0QJM0_9MICR|nr:hypothetical protein A0H76_2634 [Hepatospora eriocheir]